MAPREIVPGIFTWSIFSQPHGYDFNSYLIGDVAVDPLEGDPGRPVKRIVLTNRNHFRSAAALREKTGARVSAHPADRDFIAGKGVTVDDALAYGDRVAGFEVVDARGKSPGEIALWNAERGILIVGDACVGRPPGALALLPAKVIDDLPALEDSLRRLAKLEPETVLTADGTQILEGGAAALHALVRSFR